MDWQLGTLARRWVRWKPLEPLLVHADEVGLVPKNEGRADDGVEGAARCLKNCRDVGETLCGLPSNATLDHRAGLWIEGTSPRHEYKAGGLHRLAIGRGGFRGVCGEDDCTGNNGPPLGDDVPFAGNENRRSTGSRQLNVKTAQRTASAMEAPATRPEANMRGITSRSPR